MSHTPEPWIFTQYDLNGVLITAIECGEECLADDVDPAVGKRIVACVNACAGMKSPVDEIDNLKRDIAEYKKESSDKTSETLKMKDVLWGVLAMIDESWGASSDAEIALVDDIKALLKGGE